MKRILLAVAMSLSLIGCTENQSKPKELATDGYIFEKKEFTAPKTLVRVVEHESLREVMLAYSREPGAKVNDISRDRELVAYSSVVVQSSGDTVCTMHIVNPDVMYSPDFVGHEFLHCAYGNFHPTQ